jgi:hypothetical protein
MEDVGGLPALPRAAFRVRADVRGVATCSRTKEEKARHCMRAHIIMCMGAEVRLTMSTCSAGGLDIHRWQRCSLNTCSVPRNAWLGRTHSSWYHRGVGSWYSPDSMKRWKPMACRPHTPCSAPLMDPATGLRSARVDRDHRLPQYKQHPPSCSPKRSGLRRRC